MAPADLDRPLRPLAGETTSGLSLSLRAYVGLVEWTGKQVRPDKRGVMPKHAPSVLARYETDPARWPLRVQAIGSGYWRIVGEVADLIEAAKRMKQHWVKGIGLARRLANAS